MLSGLLCPVPQAVVCGGNCDRHRSAGCFLLLFSNRHCWARVLRPGVVCGDQRQHAGIFSCGETAAGRGSWLSRRAAALRVLASVACQLSPLARKRQMRLARHAPFCRQVA